MAKEQRYVNIFTLNLKFFALSGFQRIIPPPIEFQLLYYYYSNIHLFYTPAYFLFVIGHTIKNKKQKKTAIAFEMNSEFGKYLETTMKRFNSGQAGVDNIAAVRGKLDAVKDVMVNISIWVDLL
jgi:hypothetical protein